MSKPLQLNAFIQSVLPKAEQVLRSGRLFEHLSPDLIAETLDHLVPLLPHADVILARGSDEAGLMFELSLRLGIPFVGAKTLDLVSSDDTDSSGFLQDPVLLQVRLPNDTLAIARGAISPHSRVLVVRDVLSSGVTTLGLLHLVGLSGATAVGVATLIEKGYLGARSRLTMQGIEVCAVVRLAKHQGKIMLEQRINDD